MVITGREVILLNGPKKTILTQQYTLFKNRLFVNVLSSGMQAFAVQVLGGVFFYLISIYLTKTDFGAISWMNAVCIFITTFLSFGLEQVVVRRVAVSKTSYWAASAFLMHSVAGFVITLLILIIIACFTKSLSLLPWFFAAQGLVFIGVPLKQFLNARERFTPYGIIAFVSNVCKIILAVLLYYTNALSIDTVVYILICTATFELCCLLIFVLTRTEFRFKFRVRAYTNLIKESVPQYISVIFDMSLSRMDWILLGLLTSNFVLADYSFAYRSYELAKLPLVIIAPLILPRLSRMMALNNGAGLEQGQQLNSFNKVEAFFAALIPLALNILWVPVVGYITKGKYGESNSLQFLLLSACIPLQVFINLLWSVSFGAKKYTAISAITIWCAVVNVILNLILIPKFNGAGAGAAFFATTVLQLGLYYALVNKRLVHISIWPVILFAATAIIIFFAVNRIGVHFALQLLIAIPLYVLAGLLTGQINKAHLGNFKHFLSK